MNGTMVRQLALLEVKYPVINNPKSAEREQAERTIADLLIINQRGLSVAQVECFLRACAILRT